MQRLEVVIGPGTLPQRLDRALTAALGAAGHTVSRSRVAQLIAAGHVAEAPAGRTIGEASAPVKPGTRLVVSLPPAAPAKPEAQAIALQIVYEDEHLIVVDKPAGLVVHPAPGNPDRTLVNALLAHCGPSLAGIGGVARPGIVHRLDKETSGLLVAAKTARAHEGLSAQFAAHGRDGRLVRSYLAVVKGLPQPREGTIDAAIGRSPTNRKAFALVKTGGRAAVTHYQVRRAFGRPAVASLIVCTLETGRTHQIRVHLTARGHPLLGDPLYGRRAFRGPLADLAERLGRQALHAAVLGFVHPVSGRRLKFESPLPRDLQALIKSLEQL